MDPIVFEPYFRPQVWGGRRLASFLNRTLPPGAIGEAWLASAQQHHVSRVAEGPYAGRTLAELWRSERRQLGGAGAAAEFPLLLKCLDCREQFSVQVHPRDADARRLGCGSGKTETWYILEAGPEAVVHAGLRPGVGAAELRQAIVQGSVVELLVPFRPQAGESYFLPAGTVHAMGGGLLVAEVQQSSDATFRLFDWNRPGPDGRPRPLHIDEALATIDYNSPPVRPLVADAAAVGLTTLVECECFAVDLLRVVGTLPAPYAGELSLWMVAAGEAELAGGGYRRRFVRGEAVLAPAEAPPLEWTAIGGAAVLLAARARSA